MIGICHYVHKLLGFRFFISRACGRRVGNRVATKPPNGHHVCPLVTWGGVSWSPTLHYSCLRPPSMLHSAWSNCALLLCVQAEYKFVWPNGVGMSQISRFHGALQPIHVTEWPCWSHWDPKGAWQHDRTPVAGGNGVLFPASFAMLGRL